MKLKLPFTFTLIALSIIGFMLRLPSVFSHYDKENVFFNFMGQSLFSLSFAMLYFCKRKQ